jgi:hypothetical protein
MLADGGEAIADLAVLRDQPALFGRVASDPTAWRVLSNVDAAALARLRAARAPRPESWPGRRRSNSGWAAHPDRGRTTDPRAWCWTWTPPSWSVTHLEKESATRTVRPSAITRLLCSLDNTRESAVDGQFRLQLGDALAGGHQLLVIGGGHPRHLPGVDEVLTAPVVDRLIADLQIRRHLRHAAAGLEQVQHPTTPASISSACPLLTRSTACRSTKTTPSNPGHISLYQTRRGSYRRRRRAVDRAQKSMRTPACLRSGHRASGQPRPLGAAV